MNLDDILDDYDERRKQAEAEKTETERYKNALRSQIRNLLQEVAEKAVDDAVIQLNARGIVAKKRTRWDPEPMVTFKIEIDGHGQTLVFIQSGGVIMVRDAATKSCAYAPNDNLDGYKKFTLPIAESHVRKFVQSVLVG